MYSKKEKYRAEMLTIVRGGCLPQFSIMADEDIYYVYSAGFFSQREVITLVLEGKTLIAFIIHGRGLAGMASED